MSRVFKVTSRNEVDAIVKKGPIKGLFFGDFVKNENIKRKNFFVFEEARKY